MTGGQLATRIRREYPSLVVIVTSGYFDDPTWSEPFLQKPYNLSETATTLAGWRVTDNVGRAIY